MVISARVHYACVAMLELAIQSDEGSPVAIREIADRHGIPGPFLVQILRSLRALGWVQAFEAVAEVTAYRLTQPALRCWTLPKQLDLRSRLSLRPTARP